MARRKYGAETKAAAMSALLEGQSLSAVAAQYKIPVGTVHSWKAELMGSRSQGVITAEEGRSIGDLIMQYLRSGLTTVEAQHEVFRDLAWLRKQDAQELAVLHGVLVDKQIRILEAMGNAAGDANSGK